MNNHANMKSVVDRFSRAIGHFNSVKKMYEYGRECSDVLIQIAAVKAEITTIGKIILQEHIEHCITDAYNTGDHKAIENLNKAIEKLL